MSERMRRDNLLNKMQKEIYNKVVAGQQILETKEALIALAIRLEVQVPNTAKTQPWRSDHAKSNARNASTESRPS